MRALTPMLAPALTLPAPASADGITDALTAAIAAYQAGEIADALDELASMPSSSCAACRPRG
jgi:hypothetical protein